MSVLVVCGLNREAAIAAGPGIVALAGGGSCDALAARLAALDSASVSAVVSFGLCGAIAPGLSVGEIIVPALVLAHDGRTSPTDAALSGAWTSRLQQQAGGVSRPALLGVDAPILTPTGKADLHRLTGAAAVDMESHVAAAWAADRRLPFGVLRVVSDAADRSLPPIAGAAMRPDGSVDILGVLGALARDPTQLPPLLRTARDAGRAFATLGRVRGLLGPGFGLLGLDLR